MAYQSHIQKGLVLGASAALLWAVARHYGRQTEARLIDWGWALHVALRTSGPSPSWHPAVRERLQHEYREMIARIEEPIAAYTGTRLPLADTSILAMDRHDWIRANLENFRQLFEPIEQAFAEGVRFQPADLPGLSHAGRAVLSAEVGLLLGYLGRRVLGQYDFNLLGREPLSAGRLYFVEPNIQALQQQLQAPTEELRTWIALHEATHAHEFEIHPWVRTYLNDLLQGYLRSVVQDVRDQSRGQHGGPVGGRLWRNLLRGHGLMDAMMTAHQRQLVSRLQALMSLAEGYSNHIMHEVGQIFLPHYGLIKQRMEQRQRQRSKAEQLFLKLTGLSMKIEQYALGEAFVDRVARERGIGFVNQAWTGTGNLPTEAEIRAPDLWIERMERAAA